jgi:hypothetical protein
MPFEPVRRHDYYSDYNGKTPMPDLQAGGYDTITSDYENLLNALNRYDECLQNNPGNTGNCIIPEIIIPTSEVSYDTNENNIENRYDSIVNLRQELDTKMSAIYKTKNSVASDSQLEFDSSVYKGILWSVLASSLLFYIFSRT